MKGSAENEIGIYTLKSKTFRREFYLLNKYSQLIHRRNRQFTLPTCLLMLILVAGGYVGVVSKFLPN